MSAEAAAEAFSVLNPSVSSGFFTWWHGAFSGGLVIPVMPLFLFLFFQSGNVQALICRVFTLTMDFAKLT